MADAAGAGEGAPSASNGNEAAVKAVVPAKVEAESSLAVVAVPEAVVPAEAESSSAVVALPEAAPLPEKPKRPAPRKGRKQEVHALVPAFVAEKGHGRDGELLRDFVLRKEHLKEGHRDLAVNRWLIRGSFFDEWLQEYVQQYASEGSMASESESLAEIKEEMADACKDALVAKEPKKKVEELESSAATKGDVYALRDTLLEAVKELSVPRRRLGGNTGIVMNDACKELLKQREQTRLRQVVYKCLKGIWESGIGGEVLTMALDSVRTRIQRFKVKAGEDADVIEAMAGHEWAHLEDLVGVIEDKLTEENGGVAPGNGRQLLGPIEGRRTRLVIERALSELGGRGSSREVIEWIEANPQQLEQLREAKLNRNVRDGQKRPVWHSTVVSTLGHFRKAKRQPGQVQIYMLPDAVEPEPPAEAPRPIQDAPAKKPRERKQKAPAAAVEGGDDAAPKQRPAPKRRKRAAAAAPAGEAPAAVEAGVVVEVAPAQMVAEAPPEPPAKQPKAAAAPADAEQDRLSSALDAAFAALGE
eukprot:gb/GFBE01006725.1/.p1 GENE.gb/GFBE01006725.1/~~gb/GFBE01006725.1/.p1  ORF type:complete len:530 (+),score=113.99 gb/GFBE01006725.1/:1-1590(+)